MDRGWGGSHGLMAGKEGPEHREARGDAFLYDTVLIFSSKRVDGSFNWEPLPWRGAPRPGVSNRQRHPTVGDPAMRELSIGGPSILVWRRSEDPPVRATHVKHMTIPPLSSPSVSGPTARRPSSWRSCMGALLSSESSMASVQSLWEGGRLAVDESTASAWVWNRVHLAVSQRLEGLC